LRYNCYTRKNAQVVTGVQTTSYKSVHKLLASVFALLVPSCCNKFAPIQAVTTCYNLVDIIRLNCCKVVLTSLIQSWYNKNVTKLTTQGCNNIVISWLYRTYWNNDLATSLIISTRLLQVINSLFQTCWQLGTSSANTTCRQSTDLLQDVRVFTRAVGLYLAHPWSIQVSI
jgi:hypothetical protein